MAGKSDDGPAMPDAVAAWMAETRRLREALDRVDAYIYMKDRQFRYFYANRLTLDLFGCSAEELVGCGDERFFPKETVEVLRAVDRRVIEGENSRQEIEITHGPGDTRVYWEVKSPIYEKGSAGRIIGLCGVSTDITERKRAENALKEGEQRLRLALNAADQGWFDFDLRTGIVRNSPEYARLLGYSLEDLGTTVESWLKNIHPDDRSLTQRSLDAVLKTTDMVEAEYRRRSAAGDWRWIRSLARVVEWGADGRPLRVSGIHMDVTERKGAELALIESEARFRNIFDGVSDAIFIHDFESWRLIDVNQRMCEMYGYTREEALACTADDLSAGVEPFTAERAFANLSRACKEGPQTFEWLAKDKNGRQFWVEVRLRLARIGEHRRIIALVRDISEQKDADRALRESEAQYHALFSNSLDGVLLTTPTGGILAANPAAQAILGYDEAELRRIGRQGVVDETDPRLSKALEERQRTGRFLGEMTMVRKGGEKFPVELTSLIFQDKNGMEMTSMVIRDITERVQSQERLSLAASVFTHAREGIVITDAEARILEVNDAFVRVTGYERAEAIGANPRILQSGQHSPEFYAEMWRQLNSDSHWSGEIWNRRKNGEIYPELLTISAVKGEDGRVRNFVALFTDITQIKEHQRQLEHIAHYDMLTNLPNRVLLADRLQQAIANNQRRRSLLAVVYLDLDGFKAVNDRHGHDVGDELLVRISQRMKEVLREGDTLARIGGDEFVALLVDLERQQDCETVLGRLLEAASDPVSLGAHELQVSASIGVTLSPPDKVDPDGLLRHADQAMYLAKQTGRNRYLFFDVLQDQAAQTHRESLDRIALALQGGEFVLHFQPKVNMRTGKTIGAEALLRWAHPQRGLLPPAAFLPIVNDHPLAVDLGYWVIDRALDQVEAWQGLGLDLPVSVNLGARPLQEKDFVARIRALLAAHPAVRPEMLELEIVETSALEDIGKVSGLMKDCLDLGVKFALDDFGTGYSSLTYLRRLPASLLKIDQTFVRGLDQDSEDLAIVKGVVTLARSFTRDVLAEGVETIRHGEVLLSLGCELAQGYVIARPMPGADLKAWIESWRPDPSWTL